MENALTLINSVDVETLPEVMQRISSMQAVVHKTLKPERDYGLIPGTQKPTLLKPGAEKILMLFGLTSDYEVLDKIENWDKGFFSYTFKCVLSKNGNPITSGVGSCNSMENKYRYRWVYENEIPAGIDKTMLKKKSYDRYEKYQIEVDDCFDIANTILKMAKKRSQIDAVLTVGSLSEIFTQDIEDIQDFLQKEKTQTYTKKQASSEKLSFGKYKGKTLAEIVNDDIGYVEWLAENSKYEGVKTAAQKVLEETKAKSAPKEVGSQEEFDRQEMEKLTKIDIDDSKLPFVTGNNQDVPDWMND